MIGHTGKPAEYRVNRNARKIPPASIETVTDNTADLGMRDPYCLHRILAARDSG